MEVKEIIKEALDKQKITKIAVFDFDGTLVNTPLPDEGKIAYKAKTGKPWPFEGWWSKALSLDMTIFDMPLIKSVIESYKNEKTDTSTVTVMMTGRMIKLSNEVEAVLSAKGLSFDKYIYNTGGSTIDSKIKSLDKLLVEYPNVKELEMWDDRNSHIPSFQQFGDKLMSSGRIINFKINHVISSHHT
jgi:hypothetical protein